MKLIFLGIQGSGKSTEAKIVAERLGLPYIEMGQLLRQKAEGNDLESEAIRKSLEVGNLVPDEIAISAIGERTSRADCNNGYVLDGYPRNKAQFEVLDKDIDKVFYVKVSDKEAIRRLLLRGREDDTEEALEKRIDIYHNETEPLLDIFREKGILVEIDGERTIEEIAQDIKSRLENFREKVDE